MAQVFLTRIVGATLGVLSFVSLLAAQEAAVLGLPETGTAAPLSLPQRTVPDPAKPIDILGRYTAAVALYEGFQVTSPNLADRVLALDLDPEQAFVLLRDQVQSLAYDGHLRDPAAVFEAGAGNAYDKAAALADLLARMGYDTQLVEGADPSPGLPAPSCGSGVVASDRWQATGLGGEVLARVPLRAAASYAALHPALVPEAGQAAAQARALTQNHIWVQMRDGADWVDLDPWLTTTAYGDHPGGSGSLLQSPPQAHRVGLVLTLETLKDGALSRREILSRDLDVPKLSQSMIALGFGPKIEGLGGGLMEALGKLDGRGADMVANLMVNGESDKSLAFQAPSMAVPGQTEPGENEPGFLEGEQESGLTTGLFLTITSRVPGQADHSETRSILDLVPAQARQAAGAGLTPSQLLPVTMGKRYPAALESLRMFVVSNGATSARLTAAVGVKQLIDLADFLTRSDQGLLDGWDMLWTSWMQANRIELAAETLFYARPATQGSCAVIDRPRVLISGIASAGGDRILQWIDWTIDDYGIVGGDARTQAELRLWHGTLQAALEKEAVMQITGWPDDIFALDKAPMVPMSETAVAALGAEAADDQQRGYLILADAAMAPGFWWRVNPQTGAADARGLMHGNVGGVEWGVERGLGSTRFGSGTTHISQARQAYQASRTNAQLLAEIERDLARIEAAAAKPRCGGNEYLILETCVSIPISIAAGVAISGAIAYALLR